MKKNVLLEKSYNFALRIVRLCQYLQEEKREFILSRQVLQSGTGIGAYIEEANQGENRSDFLQKLVIANKDAFKTNYWLRLLRDGGNLNGQQAQSLLDDCEELQKMLIAALKTTKKTINQ